MGTHGKTSRLYGCLCDAEYSGAVGSIQQHMHCGGIYAVRTCCS